MTDRVFSNGTTTGNWSTLGNWSGGVVPGSSDNVSFANGVTNSYVDTHAWTINALNVNASSVKLYIQKSLTVTSLNGNLGYIEVDNGATFTVTNDNATSGTIDIESGGIARFINSVQGKFTINGGSLIIGSAFNTSLITFKSGVVEVGTNLGGASFNLSGAGAAKLMLDGPQTSNSNLISNVGVGDRFELKDLTVTSASYSGTTLTVHTSGSTYLFSSVTLEGIATVSFSYGTETFNGNTYGYVQIACYLAGTRIATPAGEVAVETLRIGDLVTTASGAARPIKWIGTRAYGERFVAANPALRPVRIAAGALGGGLPRRDLSVSPLHAMFLDGVLVPAGALVNGTTIARSQDCGTIAYFHVELDSHDVILAEGAASESFVDCDSRNMFHNAHEFAWRYPDDASPSWAFCAERVECGPVLDAIRRRLAAPAAAPAEELQGHVERIVDGRIEGWVMSMADPDAPVLLDIALDGEVVGQAVANQYRVDLDQARLADGRCGFTATIAHPAKNARIEVRPAGKATPLRMMAA